MKTYHTVEPAAIEYENVCTLSPASLRKVTSIIAKGKELIICIE
jgi:hypothetical protein